MFYYLLVFFATSLISLGLLLLKKPFFSLAKATAALLNTLLDSSMDELAKQKILIQKLGKLLSTLGAFVLAIILIIGISFVPIMLYLQFQSKTIEDLDITSFKFYGSMIMASVILFIFPMKKEKKDYSDWSILLHQMVLDNYIFSKSIFGLEKKLFKSKAKKQKERFVVVSGLARAGTTALTDLLFRSGKFHSLSYANMPFLLGVNIWKKFYKPRMNRLKQRAHGDKVMFGYKTIEALEEYFFKVFLRDKFITDNTLVEHEIDDETYENYMIYQNLVNFNGDASTYLAKNNNLILRYKSLRKHNPFFKVVLIFRHPEEHAYSLFNQHIRFSKLQEEDPFVKEYMTWLGHHEFGLNHKVFDLGQSNLSSQYERTSINYWITLWISYYTQILKLLGDENLILVDYSDLANKPGKLLLALKGALGLDLTIDEMEPFKKSDTPKMEIDPELEKKSSIIYDELAKKKIELL